MPCAPQRFLANNRNEVRTATALTPSSVRPVDNLVLPKRGISRTGSAEVKLTGSYTGAADATFDIAIVDTLVSTRLASKPIFSGAGSGTLVVGTGNTIPAQKVAVELWDAGTPITFAGVDFEGVRIRARASGAVGNAISIAIDASTLVYTTSNYSLLSDIKLGEGDENSGWKGVGFDWDSKPIGSDNVIPSNAHRIAFGEDPTVYLSYSKWEGSEFSFHVVPAVKRDIPKGTPIKFVTGGRLVTVTDGITPEVYPSIVSVFDLLDGLKSTSVLVTVDGVVADDRSPTGQSARELNSRTDAHVEPSTGSGSPAATGVVDAFAGANAVTELVTLRCFAVSPADYPLASLGGEYWQGNGSLSGDLGFIKTGIPFVQKDGRFGFTIPQKLPPGYGSPKGRVTWNPVYVTRDPADEPPICLKRITLGPAAVDQTITFTWTKRPSGDCICDKEKAPPLSAFCTGTIGTGDDNIAAMKPDTLERMRELFSQQATWVESLTDLAEGTEAGLLDAGGEGSLPAIVADLFQTLQALDGLDASIVVVPSAVAVGTLTDFTVPTLASGAPADGTPVYLFGFTGADAAMVNGKILEVDGSSTTTHVKVKLNTTGKTITLGSGRVILVPARYAGLEEWDNVFADLKTDVASIIGVQGHELTATAMQSLSEGDPVRLVADGDTWRAWKAIDTSSPLPSALAVDGWAGEDISSTATGIIKRAGTVTGLTGLTPGTRYYYDAAGGWDDTLPAGVTTSPGGIALDATTIKFDLFVPDSGDVAPGGFPIDLYNSKLAYVLAAAGLDPLGKTDASILESGDGCWRDYKGDHWWTVEGSAGGMYGPAFNNVPFYFTRKAEKDGAYYRTKEGGLVIVIKCTNLLQDGDQIIVNIGNSQYGSTYQVADEDDLPVIGAHVLYLSGGQNGTAVIKWYVNGSVTGAFADYVYDPGSPTAYSNAGLGFQIYPGGVPWRKGDKYEFEVIGGHYHFQKNGGGYGSDIVIPAAPAALSDGLSIEFTPGVAPAFVTADVYSFTARQPYAVANLQSPALPVRWEWDPAAGSTPSVVIDLGSDKTIAAAAIALHTIPAGATIELDGGTTAGVYPWTEVLTWTADVIFAEFVAAQTARYLRLRLTGAASGGIGWLWAGVPLTQTLQSQQTFRPSWKIQRGDAGTFQGGRTLAKGRSGEVKWSQYALTEDDLTGLDAFLSWTKDNNDQPFIFVPQVTRPTEAYLQRVAIDEVEFPDDASAYGANATAERRFSVTLPLQGAFR